MTMDSRTLTVESTADALAEHFGPEETALGGFWSWVKAGWIGPGQSLEEWIAAWEDQCRDREISK
jgi:hypothetical protein